MQREPHRSQSLIEVLAKLLRLQNIIFLVIYKTSKQQSLNVILSESQEEGRTLLVSTRTPGSLVMFWVLMKTAQRTIRQVSQIKQDEAAAPQANCKWQTSHGAALQVAHWNKGAADQAPAAPGFSAPREKVGFQTQLETTHENFISVTATFAPWRTLGKFLSEGYNFHWHNLHLGYYCTHSPLQPRSLNLCCILNPPEVRNPFLYHSQMLWKWAQYPRGLESGGAELIALVGQTQTPMVSVQMRNK